MHRHMQQSYQMRFTWFLSNVMALHRLIERKRRRAEGSPRAVWGKKPQQSWEPAMLLIR